MLKEFLNKFNFKFTFKSSTENYKNGIFNKSLIRVAEKYEDVMNIILPTLREERRKTYCPFFTDLSKNREGIGDTVVRNRQQNRKSNF